MVYKILSSYPKNDRSKGGDRYLWHVNWYVYRDKVKIMLASPCLDEKRGVYVVWDDAHGKALYTDSDLGGMVKKKMIMDNVDWRELKENHPYLKGGVWHSYVRHVPITERHFIMTNHLGLEVPSLVVVNDSNRRFVAKLGRDWTTGFVNQAKHKKTDPTAWRTELPLPLYLEWGAYVPSTPDTKLFNDEFDPRIGKIADMPGVAFLLDKAVKQLLYWDRHQLQWRPYRLRDPGWGVFMGADFRRQGVRFNYNVQMFTWRDSITYKNYGLVKGDDYGVCSSMFKVLRTNLLDAFMACLEIPKMLYQLDVSTYGADIAAVEKVISGITSHVDELQAEVKRFRSNGTAAFESSKLETQISKQRRSLDVIRTIFKRYRPETQLKAMESLVNEYAKCYIPIKDNEVTNGGLSEEELSLMHLTFDRKLKEVKHIFGQGMKDTDISTLESQLVDYNESSYQITVQQRILAQDPTVKLNESIAEAKILLAAERGKLEKLHEKQKRANEILDKLKREQGESVARRRGLLDEMRGRMDDMSNTIDILKFNRDTHCVSLSVKKSEEAEIRNSMSEGNGVIRELFQNSGSSKHEDGYKKYREILQGSKPLEEMKIKLNARLAILQDTIVSG